MYLVMSGRPKHQTKEFEALLREAEAKGWRILKAKGYFKCLCPCADKDKLSVALTPSGARTLKNTQMKFRRTSCWGKEDDAV